MLILICRNETFCVCAMQTAASRLLAGEQTSHPLATGGGSDFGSEPRRDEGLHLKL
jgi:hypothetical protein